MLLGGMEIGIVILEGSLVEVIKIIICIFCDLVVFLIFNLEEYLLYVYKSKNKIIYFSSVCKKKIEIFECLLRV